MAYQYIADVTLPEDVETYVIREADEQLYQKLIEGKICNVFNSRKMGKSSLAVRTIKRLREEKGFSCVTLDISGTDTDLENIAQWYASLLDTIVTELDLDIDLATWWEENAWLTPLRCFRKFIETILFKQIQENIVIFLDEIDSVLSFELSTDDFFSFIRSLYNLRASNPEYQRLTFCLLGVITASDLIKDSRRTPFNVGEAIELTGFTYEQAEPVLKRGLEGKFREKSDQVLRDILNWTNGQPFLTQKLCNLVLDYADSTDPNVAQIVQTYIIDNWEVQDNPELLRTIRRRILADDKKNIQVLELYRKILEQGKIPSDNSSEKLQLRLSGLVFKNQENLELYNKIYELIFNKDWIKNQLSKLYPYRQDLLIWLQHSKAPEYLLKGKVLREAELWQQGKSLPNEYMNFIYQSKEEERKKYYKKIFDIASVILFFMGISMMWFSFRLKDATEQLKFSLKLIELEQSGVGALQQFDSGNEPIEALMQVVQTGEDLKPIVNNNTSFKNYPTVTPIFSLQQILDNIYERNPLGVLKSLDFSPDKKSFVTVSSSTNANIYLWNWLGQTVTQLKGHQGAVNRVVFSPDGQYIAGVGEDGFVHIWNFSGKHLLKFKAHQGAGNSILFSPNSQYIATVGKDGFVRAWNKFGKKLIEFKSHKSDDSNDSSSIYFSYDSKRILIHPLQKSEAYILNLSGKQVAKLTWIPGGIDAGAVNITPNGQYIVTSEGGSMPTIWNWSGQQLAKLKGNRVNFSSDSQFVATIEFDGQAYLWNISGKLLAELKGHKSGVLDVSFSPNGKQLVTAGKDGIARVWNFSGEQIAELKRHRGSVTLVRFSPNGQLIATGGEDGKIRLWDLSGQEQLELTGHRRTVSSIDFSPDSKSLITYGNDEIARLWDVSGRQVTQLKNSKNRVRNVVFSPNNKYIATIEEDKIVQIWTFSGQILNSIKTESDYNINSVNFNNDSKTIDIFFTNKIVQTWSFSGQLLNTDNTNNQSLAKSNPQLGEDLEVETETEKDETILINNSSGKNLLKLKDKNYDSISNAILSPDGQHIAGIDQDRLVYIWDLSSKISTVLKVSQVDYFTFSPNGDRIATISKNGVVEIYDLLGRKLARWEVNPHPDGVLASFSPDWRYVAIVGEDNKVVVWSVPQNLDELLERGCNWLSSFFANHPDERERLKVCQ